MAGLTAFSMVHTLDQWRRVAHHNTALEQDGEHMGVVQLAWIPDERIDSAVNDDKDILPAGMAFDPWCRLYRCRPEHGQIEKMLWAENDRKVEAVPLFLQTRQNFGEFNVSMNSDSTHGPLDNPVDVAVDHKGRLFIAEQGARRVLIYDLVENTLLSRVNFKQAPIKLATDGQRVWVLFANHTGSSEMALLDGRSEPRYIGLPDSINCADAVAVNEGKIYILDSAGTEHANLVPLSEPNDVLSIPYAGAIAFSQTNILVVARRAHEDFLRFELKPGEQLELPHFKARHYDGRGIVITPDDHVAYWSSKGLMRATLARVRYKTQGTITSFQLDSGDFQTQWGRLFIDACLPRGTSITARCLVLDEVPETTQAMTRSAPDNIISMTINRPDLSPAMPPQILLDNVSTIQTFYRRKNGNELPWQECAMDDNFHTYEAPVIAPPGRYLWISLELTGTSRKTPRIKSLRAEYPSHDLLSRLPQVYSRDQAIADFLRRYLAMPEGQLRDLDLKAGFRHILLDPYAAPNELLPWLGSFMGLIMDERWPEQAKREMVANCTWLFRFRGTVMSLKRFIEIYLGASVTVTIIEHFKMRGLGGAMIGDSKSDALTSNAVLGAGFRIGGKLGSLQTESINSISIEDAITLNAHRFSLIIAASLTAEQLEVVNYLLDTHRPAHTIYDICTVDSGMRIGMGLHTGLTSIVGKTSGFGQLQVDASILGYTDTVGQAKSGTTVGGSRLANDSHVG